MRNLRIHGEPPFRIAALHGGPGAPGSIASVARELGRDVGVLEPYQTAHTIDGQIAELAETIEAAAEPPVTLVGWSWGAMLGLLFAARHPDLVRKLVMLSSGPLEAHDAEGIMQTRFARMTPDERARFDDLDGILADRDDPDRDAKLARVGAIIERVDAFDPMEPEPDPDPPSVDVQAAQHESVWNEAARLRRDGGFLRAADALRCPVVALHGDHDPHPAEGVRAPLASRVSDFRFELLAECGHTPWIERRAQVRFWEVLREAVG